MNVTDRLRSALASLAERDLLRTIRPRPEGVISLAGNDYLGAGADKALRAAFFESPLSRFGLASGSSALLFGESEAHEGLREVLRRQYGRESLLFPSGWQLNTGFIAALAAAFGKDVFFLADRLVHASMIDGLLAAKRHGAGFLRYPHNDCAALERLLERVATEHEIVVILTESVFSMDGDRADLIKLVALKKRWQNVLLAVDDAHGLGISGANGRGPAEEAGVEDAIDFRILTFGKAAASSGAALLADPDWLALVTNYARPLIFTTAESPLQAAWTAFVLSHVPSWSDRRARLRTLEARVRDALGTGACVNDAPILPWILGDNARTLEAAKRLEEAGFLVSAVRPPTVPEGTSRLRISLASNLTDDEIDAFCLALTRLKMEFSL